MKTGGDLAILIGSLQEAKKECDKYLTDCINIEYGYEPASTADADALEHAGDGGDDEKTTNKKKKMKR